MELGLQPQSRPILLPEHPSRSSGKERDTETGLDYFGARYFGSNMGRFLIPDWAITPTAAPYGEFGEPQSLNLYSYVRNNPLAKPDLDGHCPGDCAKQHPNPLLQVTPAEKKAINQSVRDSNAKSSADPKGGNHEEGGVSYTQNGLKVIAPAQPGKTGDVTKPGNISIDPYKAANPSNQKPAGTQADTAWHVHPSGTAESTTTNQQGQRVTSEHSWEQPPSTQDISAAAPSPTLNLVIGAGDKTVYVFNNAGPICEEKLKDFNKP